MQGHYAEYIARLRGRAARLGGGGGA
jgi:hypothetical protein